jgi:hypothetical protein
MGKAKKMTHAHSESTDDVTSRDEKLKKTFN